MYLVVTRVTPTLGAVTSSGRISVSVTRASTAMDTLVLVGKVCVFVVTHLYHVSITFSV